MLRAGVIGAGKIGEIHARAYASSDKAVLACVCDVVTERADSLARQLGVRSFDSVDRMLDGEKLDILSVCTTDTEHYEPTVKALDHGIHVLCEKPLAMTVHEAELMIARARQTGLTLGVNYNRRYSSCYLKAKEMVSNGSVGSPIFLRARLSQGGEYAVHRLRGPYYLLYELQVHLIDIFYHFGGPIDEVCAHFINPRNMPVYTTCALDAKFRAGSVGSLICSWDADFTHPIESFEVSGTKGFLCVDNIVDAVRWFPFKGNELFGTPEQEVRIWSPNMFFERDFWTTFRNHVLRYVDSIAEGQPPPVPAVDGLRSLQVAEAAIKSFEEKRWVKAEQPSV